ncbi:hypothetical protein BDV93DRAFT_293730 [Ceratobasidium sp. AG-I]|nr:hypothetical protein BDV93DRAFT_293730 [Ceratobasidium sp. AG-I]
MLNNLPIAAAIHNYTRDPIYYDDDGNVVFLVRDVLFKLRKSILLFHIAQTPRRPERITRSDIEQTNKGTSDNNPFVIPEVTAQQFCHFLFFLLGTPASPEYRYLFIDNNHTKDTLVDLLGIAVLARHFGMSEIETWSCSRLGPIVKSPTQVANSSWDKDTVLQAMDSADGFDGKFLGYNACFRFASDMHTVVRLALSPFTSALQPPLSSNLDTCVALYKDPSLPKLHPDLFGYVFTVILSLGHRSSIWANQLTREDRAVFNYCGFSKAISAPMTHQPGHIV